MPDFHTMMAGELLRTSVVAAVQIRMDSPLLEGASTQQGSPCLATLWLC